MGFFPRQTFRKAMTSDSTVWDYNGLATLDFFCWG